MAQTAAANVRLSKRGTALLMYYEDRSDGFRPALETVSKATGIKPYKVSRIRHELVQRGMIGYKDGKIIFDWERMRDYAALATPLPKRGVHTPISIRDVWQRKETIGYLGREYRYNKP